MVSQVGKDAPAMILSPPPILTVTPPQIISPQDDCTGMCI